MFHSTYKSLQSLINARTQNSALANLTKVTLIVGDGWSYDELQYTKEQLDFSIEDLPTDETMMMMMDRDDEMDYDSGGEASNEGGRYTTSPGVRHPLFG